MKKKILRFSLLAILILLFAANSYSQIIVNLQQPPPNQWHVEDMWQLTLTNTSQESCNVYLYGTVEEADAGLIFEGTSATFTLEPNYSGLVYRSDLEPADVEFTNDDYEDIVQKTGTLPAGTYTICIYVKSVDGEDMGYDCKIQIIAHPSPPELISPVDEANVTEELPVFLWLPPMPMGEFVTYSIKIVELLDGQIPIEAMEANPAFYLEEDIPATSFQFPIFARPFKSGINYAWKVTAISGYGLVIGESPVWSYNYETATVIIPEDTVSLELISPSNGEEITPEDEIVKGCCGINVKIKSRPPMNGGLNPPNEKFTVNKTELITLKAEGLDFDELRWYCKPDSECPEKRSYRMQPLAGEVEFEWEITTTPNWQFIYERRFAYFGETSCGPFDKRARGDRVILSTPDVELGKKDSTIIILKIKDKNLWNDKTVKRRITIFKERKTEDEYEIEIISEPYQLPLEPVPVAAVQDGCMAESPKWYAHKDLEAQIFDPPKVQLYDPYNTYPCNSWIRLDALGSSDPDSVRLECSSVYCTPNDTTTVYNDDVRWTWKIIDGGGQFIKGNIGQYIIYEAPSDSAEVKIEVKVDNPFDFQCVDMIPEPDTVTLNIIKSGLRLNEDCIAWRYVCDSEKDTWIRDEIEVFIKDFGFSCDVCPNYGYWIDWGDGSKPETEMEYNNNKMICSHKYEKIGYYDVTVKVFNECDTLTKTFNVPIYRPECKELVDNSLKEVNFDAKQFKDAGLDHRSLFSFINKLEPLFRKLPGRTVRDPIHDTEAKICHILLSLTTKGIDPYQGRHGRRYISDLVKSNINYSIFEHLISSGANRRQWAFYQEGNNSAKVVYIPGERPYFELTILYEYDCDCEEEDMRYRIISNITDADAKRVVSEAKKELSNPTVRHRGKTAHAILEIAVCCPPGKCE